MNNKVILRILGIGAFHSLLYLWLLPFVIYPRFGENGFYFAVITAVMVSIFVLVPVLVRICMERLGKK